MKTKLFITIRNNTIGKKEIKSGVSQIPHKSVKIN